MSKFWTTATGERTKIRDMTDTHLMNAIHYLDRKLDEAKREMPFPLFQGEMAQFYAERDYERLQIATDPAEVWPVYEDLVEEAERRGLQP